MENEAIYTLREEQTDGRLESLLEKHSNLFQGVGKAKVEPIHIFMDDKVKPKQQKQRKVAQHYMERLIKHLDELD